MSIRSWVRPPRLLLLSFLAVTILPAAALVWLGWRFFEQDGALAEQRVRERRERAADLVVVAFEQALAATEQRLGEPLPDGASGAVSLRFENDRVEAHPPLLYYPAVRLRREAPAELFTRVEELEFQQHNYARAITTLSELARSPDVSVRAAAHLRIARNRRKAGQPELALEDYRRLTQCAAAAIEGVPADLVARRARIALLSQLHRDNEAQGEAASLADDLKGGRWQLTRAAFLLYAHDAGYEPPAEALALPAAVEWLWSRRSQRASGRETVSIAGQPYTAVWSGQSALIAGPRYIEQHWIAPLAPLLQSQAVRLVLDQPGASGDAVRIASTTGLPWSVAVRSADPGADLRELSSRRHFLLWAGVLLAVLVSAGSFLIARAVNRELAAARLQSDFVSAVSHEFRTPLTLLRQITEVFIEGRIADETQRQSYYGAQERATERLHRLVESLLDFGRMEAGAKPYRLQSLDPASLVTRVVGEFQRDTARGAHEIELTIAGPMPPVDADPDALTHALWNLLDNAVKYSPDSSTVWVEVGRQEDRVSIAVRDRGLGIPRAEQAQVFSKFVRGAAARIHGIKGTGIGLAMVQQIIQAHGGAVRLESEPGAGSTFTIVLPARNQPCHGY